MPGHSKRFRARSGCKIKTPVQIDLLAALCGVRVVAFFQLLVLWQANLY